MKLLNGWALAGALLLLAMPMAADAHPWDHHHHGGWNTASARMAQSGSLAQNPYLATQYTNTNLAALQQRAAMRQAYFNNLRAQRWAMNHNLAASSVPYMGYTSTSIPYSGYSPYAGYAPYSGYAPTSGYGASPLSAIMEPVLSNFVSAPTYGYGSAQPSYYGAVPGYGSYYGTNSGRYFPTSTAFGGFTPSGNPNAFPWWHHHGNNHLTTGSSTIPMNTTTPMIHTRTTNALGTTGGNVIR
ncbi:MAG TPA: hypothetical protein VKB84_22060 [Candidatus Binataceae bacterium]|nr:hypothetical protein [Candidatus Binataceae bacterium]